MVSAFPEVIVETITPNHDFMIVACDGIWDCLTSQQAVDFVYEQRKKMGKGPTFQQAAAGMSPTKKSVSTTSANTSSGKKGASPVKSPTGKIGSRSPDNKGS